MTPKEYKQMMNYLTRSGIKDQVKFASDMAKPVDKFEVQQIKLFNEFNTRNPRTGKAGGGMLVQPSADGSRPGYAKAKFDDPRSDIKVGDDLGEGVTQTYVKKDGTVMYKGHKGRIGKLKQKRFDNYEAAKKYRGDFVNKSSAIKKVSEYSKEQQKFIRKWLKNNPDKKWEELKPYERGQVAQGQNVGAGKANVPKGIDSPLFKPLSEEGKKIAKKVYGTTNITDQQRQLINTGKITMDTKPVTFKKGEQISINQKRGSDVITGATFPESSINPITGEKETAKQTEKRFIKFIRERVKFSEKGLGGTIYRNENIVDQFPINSEGQAAKLARFYVKKLGLKYAKPKDASASAIAKKTKKLLGKASSIREEARITGKKTPILAERNLIKKIDKAHRVSKTHMAKLGLQFDTNLIGMDSRVINQIVVKPSEAKLNNLYAKQRDTLDLLKINPNSEILQNRMMDINKQVKQVVKDTSGRLIGVTIDPNTLEPSFEGMKKKNTFSKFLGDNYKIADLDKVSNEDLSKAIAKAVDTEVKRGFVPNDFKNILTNKESQKSILNYAKKVAPDTIKGLKFAFKNPFSKKAMNLLSIPGFFIAGYQGAELAKQKGIGFDKEFEQTAAVGDAPIVEKGLSTGEKIAAGSAAAGAIGTKTGRNILKKIGKGIFDKGIRPLGTRAASIPFAGLTIAENIKKGENVADAVIDPLVGLELSFPGLFKENLKKITTNPTAQRILNLGRFARLTTPVGLGITAAGLGIDAAKFTRDRIKELRAMSPEQRQQLRAEQSALAFEGARDGGLIGKKSGPPPESGPNSQGLPGLLKRVRNL